MSDEIEYEYIVCWPVWKEHADHVVASDGQRDYHVPNVIDGWRFVGARTEDNRPVVITRNGQLVEVGHAVHARDVLWLASPVTRVDASPFATYAELRFARPGVVEREKGERKDTGDE